MTGKLIAIHISPHYRATQIKPERAEVRANFGLVGDHHARPDSERQILLIAKESLEAVSDSVGFALTPGIVRENLTIANLPIQDLLNKRVRIGQSVLLELTKSCTPCSRMDEIRPGLREQLSGRRGVLAKVIEGGWVQIDDTVTIL